MFEVEKVASKVRSFILSTSPCQRPEGLKRFPNAACGDVTLLLGTALNDVVGIQFDYVAGRLGTSIKTISHAWLEFENLIVDITADQFAEIDSPVLITESGSWHKRFDGKPLHIANISVYPNQIQDIENYYKKLIKELRK